MIESQRITIVRIRRPAKDDINTDLQWLGSSLGLFGLRDKDKSCFRIFIELIKASKHDRSLTSNELAYRSKLSRGTVVHHLKRLEDSGIIIHEKNSYLLRVPNLSKLVEEIKKDIDRTCNDLEETAKQIDSRLS